MKEPVDLRELVGSDLPPEELEELSRVDGLLRSVPAPPHDVPASLTQAVAAVPLKRRPPTRRRFAVAVAFAAVLAALAFGIGRWTADDFTADYAVDLRPPRKPQEPPRLSIARRGSPAHGSSCAVRRRCRRR